MKNLLKKAVLNILKNLAKKKLKKIDAPVIGITGSVGKTTCKEMIFEVLQKKYKVLKSSKSYNTEFGLLLTILHQKSGFSSPFSWLLIIFKSFLRTYFVKDDYDYIVLEMGVDKPGDMDFLTSVVKPDIALITAIKPVHLDAGQFSTVQAIAAEKKKIFDGLKKSGIALINKDDQNISPVITENLALKTITFSVNSEADIKVNSFKQKEEGLEFTVSYKDEDQAFKTNLYGKYHLSLLLPAILTGYLTGVPPGDIFEAVKDFKLPPGRMSLIKGIKNTLILDSSYNASPNAVAEALKILDFFGKKRDKRRIFVFGNMNELGNSSKEHHMRTGQLIPDYADVLFTVGDDVVYAASAANKAGMPSENIYSSKTAVQAAKKYKEIIEEGDIILAKGSQNNVFLEIFIKEIMADPSQAEEILVRQGKKWKNIKPL
jgi:UDP-N-acetylmuramoyl-tripeptide--D-alanyl-D-alanine ligase